MSDIFKLFKNSIEPVMVKNTPRGTLTQKAAEFNVELQAIVKRRDAMAEAVSESEDRETRTSVHFRNEDGEYVKVGYYALVDGIWHSIEEVRPGKNFHSGKVEFWYAFLSSDTITDTADPVWGQVVSA